MKNKIYNEYTMFEVIQKTIQEKECQIIEMIYCYIMSKLKETDYITIRHYLYEEKKIIKVFEENGLIQLESDKGEIISFYLLTTKQKVILSYII